MEGSLCCCSHMTTGLLPPSATWNARSGSRFFTARVSFGRRKSNIVCALVQSPKSSLVRSTKTAVDEVLKAVGSVKGRGKSGLNEDQLASLQRAVEILEADGGVKAPTCSNLLDGRWRLLFTTRPGSASPIQRAFTGVEAFSVFQEIFLEGEDGARVNNVVDFGPSVGYLKVEAEANTDSRPIPGFIPRRGEGLAIFGKSSSYPPARPDVRIDFQFDQAAFNFKFLPFKVPYPVPFKLLGDETKGWLDITYLSPDGQFRLSRGNKGTLFVLVREPPVVQLLLEATRAPGKEFDKAEEVLKIAEKNSNLSEPRPAFSDKVIGKWRLRWSAQAKDANPLQKALANNVRNYQIVGGEAGEGRLENLVELIPGLLRVRAAATCRPRNATVTDVDIEDVFLEVGPFRFSLPVRQSSRTAPGSVTWKFLNDTTRVTEGNKGSIFIHTRES